MNDNNIAEDDTNPNIKQLHYILYIVLYARLIFVVSFSYSRRVYHTKHTHSFLTAARAGEKVNGR